MCFLAAIINPLDRITTLIMTDVAGTYCKTVTTCASKILRDSGLGVAFAGLVPRLVYITSSLCVFFATLSLCSSGLGGHLADAH